MSNVLSWNQALENDFHPREYSYKAEDTPEGNYDAVLDFKIWSKKVTGVTCYFTVIDTNEKIQLTVYRDRDRETKEYMLVETDFRDCPTEKIYSIEIKNNSKGNPKFINAELIS